MINETDIEAFADDMAVADRIVERATRGVPNERHIMADEVLPFIRAYVVMRDTAAQAGQFFAEQHAREMQGMSLHNHNSERDT